MSDQNNARRRVSAEEGDLISTIRNLWAYMWPASRGDLKRRVIYASGALLLAKVATTLAPFAYKALIDALGNSGASTEMIWGVAIPIVFVIAYGVANVADTGFQQLRDVLFASVGQHAVRSLARETFEHLHKLSLRFHLQRRTGGLSRLIESRHKAHPHDPCADVGTMPRQRANDHRVLRGWHGLRVDVRDFLPRRSGRNDLGLYLVHHPRLELAHRHPTRDERVRYGRQFQGRRLASQLRDRQVFR